MNINDYCTLKPIFDALNVSIPKNATTLKIEAVDICVRSIRKLERDLRIARQEKLALERKLQQDWCSRV